MKHAAAGVLLFCCLAPAVNSQAETHAKAHAEAVFTSLTAGAPAKMAKFLDAFRAEILAPTASEMVKNAARVGLSAAAPGTSSALDAYSAVPASSSGSSSGGSGSGSLEGSDHNPLCYQFPNETYGDQMMQVDPLLRGHVKVHDTCLDQGFSTYWTNDPVFTATELYRPDRHGAGDDVITNYKIVEEQQPTTTPTTATSSTCLPIVQMHGMGDFAKNPAYKRLGEAVAETLSGSKDGCPLVTPQLGDSVIADIVGGFLRPMEPSVAYFAEVVKNSSAVAAAGGVFNAIGYSQGNVILRGYAETYAGKDGYPKLHHHLSMFGMPMGVAGFPGCNMTKSNFCRELADLLGEAAYAPLIQAHLMQANYFRAPTNLDGFRGGDQGIAQLNNEQTAANSDQSGAGALRLDSVGDGGVGGNLTLVKGLADDTVQPNDSSWFGYFKDGSNQPGDIVQMEDAPWYTENWFGLQEMSAAGQLAFESVPGAHMQFSTAELTALVQKYWM